MNTKILAYMVAAVAVGYLLVAAVPEQVYMFAGPHEMLRTGDPESGILTVGPEEEMLGDTGENGLLSQLDLYKWWALDLVIAFSVYWAAKRRFS